MRKNRNKTGPRGKLRNLTKLASAEAHFVQGRDIDPDFFLQQVLNGKVDGLEEMNVELDVRIEAAKVLMPFRHKKKPVDMNVNNTTPTVVEMRVLGPKR